MNAPMSRVITSRVVTPIGEPKDEITKIRICPCPCRGITWMGGRPSSFSVVALLVSSCFPSIWCQGADLLYTSTLLHSIASVVFQIY